MVYRTLMYGGSLRMHSMHSLWDNAIIQFTKGNNRLSIRKAVNPLGHTGQDLLQLFNSNLRLALHC